MEILKLLPLTSSHSSTHPANHSPPLLPSTPSTPSHLLPQSTYPSIPLLNSPHPTTPPRHPQPTHRNTPRSSKTPNHPTPTQPTSYPLLSRFSPFSPSTEISVVVTALLLAMLGVVFVFGTVVNSLVFLVFYRRPSLRSLSNRFVLSLTSANLLSTVVVVPVHALRVGGLTPLLTTAAEGDVSEEDFWWCQASQALMALAVEAAIFSVLLIAVDRHCAVTSPLHYSMTITRGRLLTYTHAYSQPASRLSVCPSVSWVGGGRWGGGGVLDLGSASSDFYGRVQDVATPLSYTPREP
ncbi:putative G-protein coupled receptor [Penaeus vannamei]|uniref:Putative G-protein coupled receptor n=1 Tax=Penaeus vannamei TaxID=6689 RepID=A0A423SZD3_PENVA|nr:putative G-protein coupled receptor [Penaeus vannamei]